MRVLLVCVAMLFTQPTSLVAQDTRVLEFKNFTFESGVTVPNVKLEYQIRGALNSDKSNAILLPSHYGADHFGYDYLIGTGMTLDSAKYCLILTNMFANGVSSSPSNTPAPFDGPRFPLVSIRDNVQAQRELVQNTLGITKLKAVVGFSMGGQQAFQWAVSHPDMMESIVTICSNAKQYPFGIVRLQSSISALKADSDFKNGDYASPPVKGLKAIGMHYRAWTRSQAAWSRDLFDGFSDEEREQTLESLSTGFLSLDANNLLSQAETWKRHDVGKSPGFSGSIGEALRVIKAKVLLLPSNSDQYFPMSDSAFESRLIANSTIRPIETLFGHTGGGGTDANATAFIDQAINDFLAPSTASDNEKITSTIQQLAMQGATVVSSSSGERFLIAPSSKAPNRIVAIPLEEAQTAANSVGSANSKTSDFGPSFEGIPLIDLNRRSKELPTIDDVPRNRTLGKQKVTPIRDTLRSEASKRFRSQFGEASRSSESALGRMVKFIEGIDEALQTMTESEISSELHDPFAVLLLRQQIFPGTLSELLAGLDAKNGDLLGVASQKSFLVGEGGRIPFSPETSGIDRSFRYVVARSRDTNANVLISTSAPAPDRGFLQVISWDQDNQAFNFYERLDGPRWAWRGSSRHAIESKTNQKGCFQCHVGGWPVMKELEQPWTNWHSMNGSIQDAVKSGSSLAADRLFQNKSGAEDLEVLVVRPNIVRGLIAQENRIADNTKTVHGLPRLLRPLFESRTVNLVTSRQESKVNNDKFLPLTFFLNSKLLFDTIGLNPPDDFQNPRISSNFYRQAIRRFDFKLESRLFRQQGDTFFAFLVPEQAFEDVAAIESLIRTGLVTSRFVATCSAVDFMNPVFSSRRQVLSKYVPESAVLDGSKSDASDKIAGAIRRASLTLPATSAESEFIAMWDLPEADWRNKIEQRIATYLLAITSQLGTQPGVDDYIRLSESRRRDFSRIPLNESFDLMLPVTNIPINAPRLQMSVNGKVVPE